MATEYAAGVRDAKKEMQDVVDGLEIEKADITEKYEKSESEKVEMKNEISHLKALLKEHGISDKESFKGAEVNSAPQTEDKVHGARRGFFYVKVP